MRWLLSTPRHHADMTSNPVQGKNIRTTAIARARRSAPNPGAINCDQIRCRNRSHEDQHAHDQGENRADAPCEQIGHLVFTLGEQAAVDRNERCREHALAEQILQDVGNSQSGLEGVGRRRVAEIMREDAFAHDPARRRAGLPTRPGRRLRGRWASMRLWRHPYRWRHRAPLRCRRCRASGFPDD